VSHEASSSEPIAQVVRAYLDRAHSGDWEGAFALLADDLVVHVPGRSVHAGELRGKDAFRGYLDAALARARGSQVEVELVETLVGEERVALMLKERFLRDEGALEIRRANVYRVRAGRIEEIRIFEANQYEVDELFAD
jgi:ketosteroid isomerase-like protein